MQKAIDRHSLRRTADFPIFNAGLPGRRLVYLDNAATTQKPQCVIDAISAFYAKENANVHRGIHYLSQVASDRYESTRIKARKFLGADSTYEVVFTSGTTASINLLAHSLGSTLLTAGDEILITYLEHHSNILPWKMLCDATGATLKVVPITSSGDIIMSEFENRLNARTKIVAVTHVSNVLGTLNPVASICKQAKTKGAVSVIDGAQSAAHLPVNLQAMGADFFVCSAHKIYGPTGIGILCGRRELLERMPPFHTGSGMVESVTPENITFLEVPARFEAGTPHIAGAVGLSAALDYLAKIGMDAVAAHEHCVLSYACEALSSVDGLKLIGAPKERTGVISFVMDCAHPHDIAQILDNEGVAIRSGHHCAYPLMQVYNVPATARVSLGIYNTDADVDLLISALHQVRKVFA